jgi:hypothetical protein
VVNDLALLCLRDAIRPESPLLPHGDTMHDTLGSTVTGTCVALHRGRTTHVWQTTVTNAEGKLCAVVTQTQLVLQA